MSAPWRLLILMEIVCVGSVVMVLVDHWADPWYVFIPKALNVALLCGCLTVVIAMYLRDKRRWREHSESNASRDG